MKDPMETGRYDEPTAEEQREYETRALEALYAEMAAENARNAGAYQELQRVRAILRAFVLAPISVSSLQPVIDLAHKLNPSLREELDAAVSNPFGG